MREEKLQITSLLSHYGSLREGAGNEICLLRDGVHGGKGTNPTPGKKRECEKKRLYASNREQDKKKKYSKDRDCGSSTYQNDKGKARIFIG